MKSLATSIPLILFLLAGCFGATPGDEGHGSSEKAGTGKAHAQKAHLVLSQRQMKRLGIRAAPLRRYHAAGRTYQIPPSGIVRVLDTAEVYVMHGRPPRVVPMPVRFARRAGARFQVQLSQPPPSGALLIIAGAAMARLAWLNRSEPAAGHDH